jgi:hypothetical protein
MDSTASFSLGDVAYTGDMNVKQYKIYRYKFTESFMEEMEAFSKIHQFDDRKTFKEAWQKWITEFTIQPQIQSEVERLQHNGYDGDVMKKMFHSARFYFRKKGTLPTPQQETPLKSTNKDKTTKAARFTKEFLKLVDEHITTILAENLKDTTYDISPATAYDDFYKKREIIICEEFLDKSLNGTLKKTYKNRFYNIKVTESSIKPFNKKP